MALAELGPDKETKLLDMGNEEPLHRLLIRRAPASGEEKWLKECPKPDWWE